MCDFRGGWSGYKSFAPLSQALADRPRQLGLQKGTTTALAGGYVNPSARCPICGASVYFYKSPFGGKVYFERLGPPWPKHPCTSGSAISKKTHAFPAWQEDSWLPLTHATIREESAVRQIYSISGVVTNRECSFFFRSEEIVMAEVIRIKKIARGKFSISLLDFNTLDKTWCIWSGDLRTSAAHSNFDPPLSKSEVWHDLKEDFGYSMADSQAITEWTTCALCNAKVHIKNLRRHNKKVHALEHT